MLDPHLTPMFIKELIETVGVTYSTLIQVNGCMYCLQKTNFLFLYLYMMMLKGKLQILKVDQYCLFH